jgi:hypothetical protein
MTRDYVRELRDLQGREVRPALPPAWRPPQARPAHPEWMIVAAYVAWLLGMFALVLGIVYGLGGLVVGGLQ